MDQLPQVIPSSAQHKHWVPDLLLQNAQGPQMLIDSGGRLLEPYLTARGSKKSKKPEQVSLHLDMIDMVPLANQKIRVKGGYSPSEELRWPESSAF